MVVNWGKRRGRAGPARGVGGGLGEASGRSGDGDGAGTEESSRNERRGAFRLRPHSWQRRKQESRPGATVFCLRIRTETVLITFSGFLHARLVAMLPARGWRRAHCSTHSHAEWQLEKPIARNICPGFNVVADQVIRRRFEDYVHELYVFNVRNQIKN